MRYPTRDGLAISPYELGYEQVAPQRRISNSHHRYWPRNNYQGFVTHIFRGLVTNVHTMYIEEHDQLHRDFSAPQMPKEGLMIDCIDEYLALNGVIEVVKDRVTAQHYQITAEQWARIRTA